MTIAGTDSTTATATAIVIRSRTHTCPLAPALSAHARRAGTTVRTAASADAARLHERHAPRARSDNGTHHMSSGQHSGRPGRLHQFQHQRLADALQRVELAADFSELLPERGNGALRLQSELLKRLLVALDDCAPKRIQRRQKIWQIWAAFK